MLNPADVFGDETGVSPVIGVVLMVAITVMLAATAQTFVFSYTEDLNQRQSPQAGFSFETGDCGDEPLLVTHTGGDVIDADQLYIRSPDLSLSGPFSDPSGYETTTGDDGNVKAGDTATVCTDDLDGITVQVVWVSETGDDAVVLAEWNGK